MKNLFITFVALVGSLMSALPAVGQSTGVVITGTVIDDVGEPVIGATIAVEKTPSLGTATDYDGNYTLTVKALPVTLKVTSLGYQAKSVKVTSADAPVNITLASNSEMLSEVVVVGYGQVRKADLAGSVSVLSAESFQAQPITSVGDALQGRVSGVNVITSGVPGGSPSIRVRGSNSINKSNEPLYVVDGLVRESGLEGLNPEDISTMQILKDASSTAIYGSRGANGVVIISTKRGKVGQSQITFDASAGISTATHLPKIMNAQQYATALLQYSNLTSEDAMAEYLDGTNQGIDWLDEVFRTGNTQNYKLTFNKGTEGMQTFISANYMREEGVIRYSSYERFSARANVHANVTSWLETTVDVDLSHGIGHGIGGFDMTTGPVWSAFTYSPTMTMFGSDGVTYNKDPYNSIMNNPVAEISLPNERRRDIINGKIDLRFNICKGLTFTTSNGVDYRNLYSYNQNPSWRAPGNTTGMGNSNGNRWLLQSTNNFTYTNRWEDGSNLTATAVWEATSSTTRNMSISGNNLLTESVGWWNVGVADTKGAGNGYSKWSLLSAVGRVIYSWKDRYMATVTFRADGSSRLQNNKWSYFPSVALAWTVSNEKFFEAVHPTISNLKLRASWGIIGNQDISPYQTLALLARTSTYYGTTTPSPGYWTSHVSTPDLNWEKTRQVDVGLDVSFLNGRFDLNLDYYYKRTSDALLQTTPPYYLGGIPYYINAGEVSNTGFDISFNANIIHTRDWNWTTGIQGSYSKNRVEKLLALEPTIYSGSIVSIVQDALIVKEGEAIGSFYGYRWAGIDEEGYDTYYTAAGEVTRTPAATDREVIGKASPDFTLGWNNTLNWKNWSLNIFFNGAFGAKRLNAMRYAMNTMIGNSRFVTDATWLDEVGKTIADPSRYVNNKNLAESTQWLESADYWRLENVALAYQFSRKQTGFADIRLSFAVQNAFTITGYKGVNPAALTFKDGIEWKKGVDFGTSPAPRSYTLGVRFVF